MRSFPMLVVGVLLLYGLPQILRRPVFGHASLESEPTI